MDDQDRVSQASSVATISYIPVIKVCFKLAFSVLWLCAQPTVALLMHTNVLFLQECDGKVQTFGKRCQAAKRDPNCPVVIRGWLNKKVIVQTWLQTMSSSLHVEECVAALSKERLLINLPPAGQLWFEAMEEKVVRPLQLLSVLL